LVTSNIFFITNYHAGLSRIFHPFSANKNEKSGSYKEHHRMSGDMKEAKTVILISAVARAVLVLGMIDSICFAFFGVFVFFEYFGRKIKNLITPEPHVYSGWVQAEVRGLTCVHLSAVDR
jgi:hypothetical protein